MGTGAVGGADDVRTTHRPRMPRWLAVALTLAVALGLVAVGGLVTHGHSADGATSAGDPTVILGYDDSSAAELGVKQHLRLTSRVVGGPLYPGVRRTLRIKVDNPYHFAVRVMQVSAKTRSTTAAGCRPAWFRSTSFATHTLRKGLLVKPHRKGVKRLRIVLVNLPTVNQDACQSARFTLSLRAVARRA